jgi:hypothetical protein
MRAISLLPRRVFERHQVARFKAAGDQDAVAASAFNLNGALLERRAIPDIGHGLSRFEEMKPAREW